MLLRCRRCSCAPCARTRPTPRCRATSCSCAAGYVRRVAPGIYSWLPLGKRVLENVARVVREEMDRIGAQEVHFPALLPREIYEASGRWTEYGDTLFRLKDRKGADYLLGPTHEEMFTLLVKGEYSSYKDYPGHALPDPDQVPRRGAAAGRHAARPRVRHEGLVLLRPRRRGPASSPTTQHRDAYQRIFDRLGLDYRIVFAVSGAMGGSASEEFLAPAPTGEDTFVAVHELRLRGQHRGRRDRRAAEPGPAGAARAAGARHARTRRRSRRWSTCVNEHCGLGDSTAADTLKNVVRQGPRARRRRTGSCWSSACPATARSTSSASRRQLEPARSSCSRPTTSPSDPELVAGLHRPAAAGRDRRSATWSTRCVVDGTRLGHRRQRAGQARRVRRARPRLQARRHDRGRRDPRRRPLRALRRARCRSPAASRSATSSSSAASTPTRSGSTRSGPDGKPIRVTMGSYGVGVSRAVAAIAEQTLRRARAWCWPREVAPADVHIVADRQGRASCRGRRARSPRSSSAAGLRVLLDDRPACRPG